MPKKIEEFLYILCPDRAYIAPIHMMGPIVQPLQVSKPDVAQMLLNGNTVYEYDLKTKNTFRVSMENLNKAVHADPKPVSMGNSIKRENTIGVTITPNTAPVADVVNSIEVEDTEVVTEEPNVSIEESAETTSTTDTAEFSFEYNEDGTVNENKINWASYSKTERKSLRAAIVKHNEGLVK